MASLLGACATTTPLPQAANTNPNALPSDGSTTLAAAPAATAATSVPTVAPPAARAAADAVAASPQQVTAAAEALLEDSLQPGVKVDLDEAKSRADLWVRVRAGFAMQELDNELVHKAEGWYSARPDYVQRMTERGSRYLFHVVEEVEKRGMPTELALLPFIESAFNPQAMSTAKAGGMWQFVPATGRDFALKQNIFRDDRRDVLASTRAALDYLQRLHKMFGDWQLALAAYNWGQGNVAKAIARNEKLGLPTDYESLRMPDETRYYVPKLQAVKNIVLAPQNFALSLPPVANHPYFLSVNIERDMDVEVAARLAGVSIEEFKLFNPQMNKPVILANASPQVLLPYDNASAFAINLAAHRGPLASWTAWVVPRTMKSAEAAREVGMSEPALREINLIPPKMLVKKGSTLLVPRSAHRSEDVSDYLADNASISLAPDVPPLRRVAYKAGKGETVASVAERYKVSARQVAQWNKLGARAAFKPGQQVVVYTASSGGGENLTRVASNASKAGSVGSVSKPARSRAKSSGGRATTLKAAKSAGAVARK
ncbi:MAG: transglycosylase SLT domain-containing protein [Burkholderiaceae bacterium]